MIILGIETSCDETAVGIIEAKTKDKSVTLLANINPSSLSLHAKTGGIIPEIAAREQVKYIIPVINEALEKAGIPVAEAKQHIDAIAVTYGPGLIGSLLVGVETAKALSLIWNKPIIPVNHLFGHIYANWIQSATTYKLQPITFPILAPIVSGGHTDLVVLHDHKQITWLGGTRDDAAGEALDKIGRLLGLPYPGGVAIEQQANHGNPKALRLPRPLLHDPSYDFSFSGLKTAVLREVQKNKVLSEQQIADISYATQDAIFDVLIKKTLRAAEEYKVSSIVLAGGVSANKTLRDRIQKQIEQNLSTVTFTAPDKNLCTDNGAMIASAAFYHHDPLTWKDITADPELYFD